MSTIFRNTALAAAIIVSSATFAVAQSGPVDSKGQAGGAAHRLITPDTAARGDYDAPGERVMASPESYQSAEIRRGANDGFAERSVSGPRGYGSDARMSAESSAEMGGPQDRR